nr:hypothetical protein BdHM001_09520 [Bdellovibrio sp. HM001]BFD67809.1 hypothetical protein HAGR004_28310 [Bdellovibrio sp. HAGR004]
MKLFIFVLSLFAVSTSFAKGQKLENLKELCALEAEHEEDYDNTFAELGTLDIKEINSLTAFELKLVNAHLVQEQYTTKALTFAEIKKFFSEEGEQPFNDLHIITFQSKVTGRTYIQVKTWPGDNPYGLIFDAKTGKTLAHNGDDSIVLLTQNGPYSCWSLNK